MSAEFELTRNITIGQYLPTGSVIHRLDPRYKVTAFVIMILAIAVCNTYLGNLFALAVCLVMFRLSHIPLHYGISGSSQRCHSSLFWRSCSCCFTVK